jgi:hypothetical protein
MNQLEDPELIEALCHASSAAVPVDLIVRWFCCLLCPLAHFSFRGWTRRAGAGRLFHRIGQLVRHGC